MSVVRNLSTLKVNDRLSYGTLNLNKTQLANMFESLDSFNSWINISCEFGYLDIHLWNTGNYGYIYIELWDTNQNTISELNGQYTIPTGVWSLDSETFDINFTLGKITSLTIPSTFTNYADIFQIINVNRTLYGIFRRFNQFLTNHHAEVDYYLRMGSEFVTPTHNAASNFSGCTVNSTEVKMIGNYLYVKYNLTLNSTAYNKIGTGNVDNTTLATISIPNFFYASYDSLTTEERFATISSFSMVDIAANSGTSSGQARPTSYYITMSSSGNTLTLALVVSAVHTTMANHQVEQILPVQRCPYN